jgi:hypothetical protein
VGDPSNAETGLAEIGARIREAEAATTIAGRDRRVPYREVDAEVAEIADRAERNELAERFYEAVEAINPGREERLDRLRAEAGRQGFASLTDAAERDGLDLTGLDGDVRRLLVESETIYFAALRRYLARIDIEQGDASRADLLHVLRGSAFDRWFDARRVPHLVPASPGPRGWRACAATLVDGVPGGDDPAAAAGRALAESRLTEPAWLAEELRLDVEEALVFADFAAFSRLHDARRACALFVYEQRLHRGLTPTLARAYYAGTLSLLVGVRYPEALFLADVPRPFAAARELQGMMLGATLQATVRDRHGDRWWAADAARSMVDDLLGGESRRAEDAVAKLGYHRLDWRPILREIRSRLVGEMSGYGGPNLTTRAGTRKV